MKLDIYLFKQKLLMSLDPGLKSTFTDTDPPRGIEASTGRVSC